MNVPVILLKNFVTALGLADSHSYLLTYNGEQTMAVVDLTADSVTSDGYSSCKLQSGAE